MKRVDDVMKFSWRIGGMDSSFRQTNKHYKLMEHVNWAVTVGHPFVRGLNNTIQEALRELTVQPRR